MHTHKLYGPAVWIGVLSILAGIGLFIFVPALKALSTMLFFSGVHTAGLALISAAAYIFASHKLGGRRQKSSYDFGWSSSWTLGPLLAAKILFASAILLEILAPRLWPIAIVCTLLAASFFAGSLFARSVGSVDTAVLPMVDLLPPDISEPVILDAGCGSGRTTIALGRALQQGSIVALDRFDAGYIEGGGKTLLEQNLCLAGLQSRVRITPGDITRLPFADATIDAAVSAHAMDHLGRSTDQGLREIHRVLKPGARFLLIVWIPGWTMFSIANVLSFALTSPAKWRQRIEQAGFRLADEGRFNGYWFAVLERSAVAPETLLPA